MSAEKDINLLEENMEIITNDLHELIGDSTLATANIDNSMPQFELQYLCSSVKSAPLISNAANPKQQNGKFSYRYGGNGKQKFQKSDRNHDFLYKDDDEDLKIDVGLGSDGKERNPILRLFLLFREMHYYLNEFLPCTYAMFNTYNLCLIPSMRSSMPATMNIQHQVKKASIKCAEFLFEMERIISENEVYDEVSKECQYALENLRKTMCQLDNYKRKELEHKHGHFLNDTACFHGQNLIKIVGNLICYIRYANFRIYFYDWNVSKKYNKPNNTRRLKIPSYKKCAIENECKEGNNNLVFKTGDLLFKIMHEVREEQQQQQQQKDLFGISKAIDLGKKECGQLPEFSDELNGFNLFRTYG